MSTYYLLPKLSKMMLGVSNEFTDIDLKHYSDDKIQKLIINYQSDFKDLESTFTSDVHFSESAAVIAETERRWQNHFYLNYPEIKDLEMR